MKNLLERIFRRYGVALTVVHEGNRTETRAFFMPTASRSWQNMEQVYTPLGETPRGQYNYIGPAGVEADAGDLLIVGEKRYTIRRMETIRDDSGIIYRWGLCVERGGIDSWGSEP